MDWDAIAGLMPAALIIALILRKALQRQRKQSSPPTRPRRSSAKFQRGYEPIEPK